jgi:hypothetical protein
VSSDSASDDEFVNQSNHHAHRFYGNDSSDDFISHRAAPKSRVPVMFSSSSDDDFAFLMIPFIMIFLLMMTF